MIKKIVFFVVIVSIVSVISFKRFYKPSEVNTGPLCMPEQDSNVTPTKKRIETKHKGYSLEQLSTSTKYVKIVTQSGSCLHVKKNKLGTAPCPDPEYQSDFLYDSESGSLRDPISLLCVDLSQKSPVLKNCL